jgi:hypothetical protein
MNRPRYGAGNDDFLSVAHGVVSRWSLRAELNSAVS